MNRLNGFLIAFIAISFALGVVYIFSTQVTLVDKSATFELERSHLIDSLKLEAQIETRFWKDEFNRINKELYRLEQETKEINNHYEQVFDSINNADANDIIKRLSGIRFEPDSI